MNCKIPYLIFPTDKQFQKNTLKTLGESGFNVGYDDLSEQVILEICDNIGISGIYINEGNVKMLSFIETFGFDPKTDDSFIRMNSVRQFIAYVKKNHNKLMQTSSDDIYFDEPLDDPEGN